MSAREDYAELHANTSGPSRQGQTSREAQLALDEIDRLRRWKAEATEVLHDWYAVADAIETIEPAPLGCSFSEHALTFVGRLAEPEATP